ncbi:family 16 glycoside hydrolase [Halostagnicola sp. A-GB9-2]|uniref:family 16 glycoside hydrolase n=1 Tax=Halostagnicola sp. A-GB9-2 TaxID=3048066 RepID=UPI0024BFF92C|nr:family 16 glycoside hydrolase [Halostagnicola sp. A-GB9-2]MDJ1434065.1 DUF1080 domain-containing protein [Halostagnicola sp. A-GB9-2]
MNRRQVLQSIGATGVASAVMTGSAYTRSSPQTVQQLQADLTDLDPNREIPTGSQFFSFNELEGYSNADLIHLSADAGLDTYEPPSIDDADAMLEAQNETGVYMSSVHIDIEDVEADPEGVAETYEQFAHEGDYPALIDPYYGGEAFWSDEDNVREFAERVNAVADEMADHGFEFGYHNHDFEFQRIGDEYAYDIFAQEVEDHVHLQLDVAWVFAGEERPDPIDYILEYGDKIRSLHMKNWEADDSRTHGVGERGNGSLTEIHEGDLSMRSIATAARNASNVEYLIYEYDNSPQPYDSFEYAGEWLNEVNSPWRPDGIPGIPGGTVHPAIAEAELDGDWIDLFDGESLDDWTPKIQGYEAGEDPFNTFRVEDGLLKVRYDEYEDFENEFGHLFYDDEFSHYVLHAEWRFPEGEQQVDGGAAWAYKNNGLMLHGELPSEMGIDQDFPRSVEYQLVGPNEDGSDRPLGDVCTPDMQVEDLDGDLVDAHCWHETTGDALYAEETYDGHDWVSTTAVVRGNELVQHIIRDQGIVLEYQNPQLEADGTIIDEGTISVQSESHPTDFRTIEVLELDPDDEFELGEIPEEAQRLVE